MGQNSYEITIRLTIKKPKVIEGAGEIEDTNTNVEKPSDNKNDKNNKNDKSELTNKKAEIQNLA